ncbi:MAG: response regulator receiver protein [Bacteroidota bacterium]|nr:response regulator receiver protein [Bacteroidota bacterium]
MLADDDRDDRYFFEKALEDLSVAAALRVVSNGEALMSCLLKTGGQLPDILFLDLNMPCKGGKECLQEI